MQENGLGVSKAAVDDYCIDFSDLDTQGEMGNSSKGEFAQNSDQTVVKPNGVLNFEVTPETKGTVVSDEASHNYDSVKVGSVVSSGDCVSVMVNLEPKESLSSEGKYDSVAEKEGRREGQSSLGEVKENDAKTVLAVVISSRAGGNQSGVVTDTRGSMMSKGDAPNCDSVPVVLDSKESCVKIADTKGNQCVGAVSSAKKGTLSRSESFDEQCRVCQQSSEETLIDLGCQCRGGLAKAHRSCIDAWFRTRGSNKCEICQQVATNVSPPESQASRNYWVWRIDPTFRGPGMAPERERACYSPLWVAFSILIGGLLLDVLISISLGVSALPVNIIIGVLVVLGLGTALRLALECCHELSLRRAVQRAETNITLGPIGYHPSV